MAVFEILKQKDEQSGCSYNGLLSSFLEQNELPDETLRKAFAEIAESEPETQIICDLADSVKLDAISNRIIHYRDISKLTGNPIVYPYILYATDGNVDRAMLVLPYEENGYLYARGYYYCMSEAGGEFYDARNEILEICTDSSEEIVSSWNRLKDGKAGMVQRQLDRNHYKDFEELKAQAYKASELLKEEASATLKDLTDRRDLIRRYVVRWFLLKKLLYVQYMVNKSIRAEVHEGDIHKQRNQARLNADEVPILSYRQMWVIGTEEEGN